MTYTFTTVIVKEDRWYVARCVELGVVSQGKSIETAQKNLKEAVKLYLGKRPTAVRGNFLKKAPLVTTLEVSNV